MQQHHWGLEVAVAEQVHKAIKGAPIQQQVGFAKPAYPGEHDASIIAHLQKVLTNQTKILSGQEEIKKSLGSLSKLVGGISRMVAAVLKQIFQRVAQGRRPTLEERSVI